MLLRPVLGRPRKVDDGENRGEVSCFRTLAERLEAPKLHTLMITRKTSHRFHRFEIQASDRKRKPQPKSSRFSLGIGFYGLWHR
jgi:hypothetical protein